MSRNRDDEPAEAGGLEALDTENLQIYTQHVKGWLVNAGGKDSLRALLRLKNGISGIRRTLQQFTSTGRRKKKRKRTATQAGLEDTQGEGEGDYDPREQLDFHSAAIELLEEGKKMFQVKTFEDDASLDALVQTLWDIVKTEVCVKSFEDQWNEVRNRSRDYPGLAGAALGVLGTLWEQKADLVAHGAAQVLFLSFLPTSTSFGCATREAAIAFLAEKFEDPGTWNQLRSVLRGYAQRVNDRMKRESQKLGASAIVRLWGCMSKERSEEGHRDQNRAMTEAVAALSTCERAAQRGMGIDIAGIATALAVGPQQPPRPQGHSLALDNDNLMALLEVLLLRSNDRLATARSRSLAYLGQLLELGKLEECAPFKHCLNTFFAKSGNWAGKLDGVGECTYGEMLVAVVKTRIGEERPMVRKAALRIMDSVVHLDLEGLSHKDFADVAIVLTSLREEPSVSVRQAALEAVDTMVVKCLNDFSLSEGTDEDVLELMQLPLLILQRALLPAYSTDGEESVRRSALETIHTLLIAPLEHEGDDTGECVWYIFRHLTRESRMLLRPCFAAMAANSKRPVKERGGLPCIPPSVIKVLEKSISCHPGPSELDMWACMNSDAAKHDPELAVRCFALHNPSLIYNEFGRCEAIRKAEGLDEEAQTSLEELPLEDRLIASESVLKVLAKVSPDEDSQERILSMLRESLECTQCPLPLISFALDILQAWSDREYLEAVCSNLLSRASGELDAHMRFQKDLPTEDLRAWLATLGGVAMIRCGRKRDDANWKKLKSVLTSIAVSIVEDGRNDPSLPAVEESLTQLSQTGLTQLTQRSTYRQAYPAVCHAEAVLTLGKMALIDEKEAKHNAVVFIHFISKKVSPKVKANSLHVLADFAASFCGSVDKYLPSFMNCCGDPDPFVRHTAIVLMVQLLGEGFVKWKPQFLYHFCLGMVDDVPIIRKTAEEALTTVIIPQNEQVLTSAFVGLLFVLNNCTEHPKYNTDTSASTCLFQHAYDDDAHTLKRQMLLKLIVRHIPPEKRFTLHGRLHTEVLCLCTEDGNLENDSNVALTQATTRIDCLKGAGYRVLIDTLSVLSLKEMQLGPSMFRRLGNDGEDGREGDEAGAVEDQWLKTVLQKHMEITVMPVLGEVQGWLRKKRSPAQKHLANYLATLRNTE